MTSLEAAINRIQGLNIIHNNLLSKIRGSGTSGRTLDQNIADIVEAIGSQNMGWLREDIRSLSDRVDIKHIMNMIYEAINYINEDTNRIREWYNNLPLEYDRSYQSLGDLYAEIAGQWSIFNRHLVNRLRTLEDELNMINKNSIREHIDRLEDNLDRVAQLVQLMRVELHSIKMDLLSE